MIGAPCETIASGPRSALICTPIRKARCMRSTSSPSYSVGWRSDRSGLVSNGTPASSQAISAVRRARSNGLDSTYPTFASRKKLPNSAASSLPRGVRSGPGRM